MFAFLLEYGELPVVDDVKHWALENGVDEEDARDLANMCGDIRYLRAWQDRGGGWGRPAAWFTDDERLSRNASAGRAASRAGHLA
jgi:hypothetical protein